MRKVVVLAEAASDIEEARDFTIGRIQGLRRRMQASHLNHNRNFENSPF